jgi:hypothetical protein
VRLAALRKHDDVAKRPARRCGSMHASLLSTRLCARASRGCEDERLTTASSGRNRASRAGLRRPGFIDTRSASDRDRRESATSEPADGRARLLFPFKCRGLQPRAARHGTCRGERRKAAWGRPSGVSDGSPMRRRQGGALIVGLGAPVPLASPAKQERFWYDFRNCGFRVLGEWSPAARPHHSTPNEARRSACGWRTGGSHV